MRFIRFFSAGIISLLIACKSLIPTPLLVKDLISLNNQTQALFLACSDGAVYNPHKQGCDPQFLETKAKETRDTAKNFIAGDIKQPHGYDVYLQTSLIYFRIALRNENEYSEAERIARQFFEIQKASSGKALNLSRFYWAAMTSEYAAWQLLNSPKELTETRNQTILLCAAEAAKAFDEMEEPFMRARLFDYIQLLILIGGVPQ